MLNLENISFAVQDGKKTKEIIHNVNLSLPSGKLTVITGPNGGGKSTLARLIAGIEKPSAGRREAVRRTITERAKAGIGFAFQQPVRFKGIRVIDLLRLATGKQLTTQEACEYLSAVGLCALDYVRREVNASLSGGELKRIEIATVFAKGSEISIFDEPEAGIDLWSFQNLIELFQNMRQNIHGSSILIISHQERILNIADEIIVMKNGSVDKQGPKDEILPSLTGSPLAVGNCCKLGIGRDSKC